MPDKVKIWIDVVTGTWGLVEDLAITEMGVDKLERFSELSDADRIEFGRFIK